MYSFVNYLEGMNFGDVAFKLADENHLKDRVNDLRQTEMILCQLE